MHIVKIFKSKILKAGRIFCGICLCAAWPVQAQDNSLKNAADHHQTQSHSAHDKPIESAEDGFGSQLAGTQVGLYGAHSARGFSPTENGNILLNGMYYRPILTFGFLEDSRTYVGIGAQALPFAAPGGIVDYKLPSIDNFKNPYSLIAFGQREMHFYKFITAGTAVLKPNKLSVTMGLNMQWTAWQNGFKQKTPTFYVAPAWNITPALELRTYYAHTAINKSAITPYYYAPQGNLPDISPKIYTNPPWLARNTNIHSLGFIAKYVVDDWTIKLHYFDNNQSNDTSADDSISIDETGRATRQWSLYSNYHDSVNGGELRISKAAKIGMWRSLTVFSWRKSGEQSQPAPFANKL